MHKNPTVAKTISDVFQEFLEEQSARLKSSTLRKYEDVLFFFKESLNGYAYQCLSEEETTKFEKYFNASGDDHKEFCDIFGPEKILSNVSEFTDYFMVRKVMASKEQMRSVGTVIKKLGKWLEERQYVGARESQEIVGWGTKSSTDLPASEEFREMLEHCTESCLGDDLEIFEDRFTITSVERGKLYLSPMLSDGKIVLKLPDHVINSCKEGWTISGEITKKGKSFFLTDVWNVYP